jgi:hypothetical protein
MFGFWFYIDAAPTALDGSKTQADGNSFPVFSLGWTIGANGV